MKIPTPTPAELSEGLHEIADFLAELFIPFYSDIKEAVVALVTIVIDVVTRLEKVEKLADVATNNATGIDQIQKDLQSILDWTDFIWCKVCEYHKNTNPQPPYSITSWGSNTIPPLTPWTNLLPQVQTEITAITSNISNTKNSIPKNPRSRDLIQKDEDLLKHVKKDFPKLKPKNLPIGSK